MEMPKPGEPHKRLGDLTGTWSGPETLYPGPWNPEKRSANGRMVTHIDVDGFWLVMDYVEEQKGEVCYRGHGVVGWDPKGEVYTMHWFDSMGMGANSLPATGTWDGDTLSFTNESEMGHSKYTYRLADDELTFSLEISKDGEDWSKMMEGTYTRD